MKWFKHDSNASIDAKVEKLLFRYGLEGYGLYFYCLEMIARTVEKHNLTFELEHDAELIAHRVGLSQSLVQDMMSYMVELKLFENDRGVITCLKMATRTDEYTQKLLKTTQNNTLSGHCRDTIGIKSELIEENRIEENRKSAKQKRFAVPSIEEVTEYMKNRDEAERFCHFYESKGWLVGKNKMKSWKSAASGWLKRNNKTASHAKGMDPANPANKEWIEKGYSWVDGYGWCL